MYPLFESLCIQNGKILNSKWHEKRFRNAYLKYFGKSAYFNLLDEINIPKEFKKGNVKLRVLYGETGREIQFEIYKLRKINTIGIQQDIEVMSRAAIAYNLKKCLKFSVCNDDLYNH